MADGLARLTDKEIRLECIRLAVDFAAEIQRELEKVLTSPNRSVKQAGFHVLVGAAMPNILIEVGFLTNLDEAKALGKSQYRRKIARAIYESIIQFKEHYEK